MVEETYSAGLISQSFWFVEMKKVIKLIDDGKSEEEIKKMCIKENHFWCGKRVSSQKDIWIHLEQSKKTG